MEVTTDSRITGGHISNLTSANLVTRIGYVSISVFRLKDHVQVNVDGENNRNEWVLDGHPQIQKDPLVEILAGALRQRQLYLSEAHFPQCTPEVVLGDLYLQKR